MRRKLTVPRILKIDKVNGFKITCMFNNGEVRLIDFAKLFKEWNISESDAEFPLLNPDEFKKVTLRNKTLSWENIVVALEDENGNLIEHPYEIDPLTLFEHSEEIQSEEIFRFGSIIKTARKTAGLTQEELAQKSGTSRFYISRLENDRTDIELSTFRKIVEAGLGKHLKLVIE